MNVDFIDKSPRLCGWQSRSRSSGMFVRIEKEFLCNFASERCAHYAIHLHTFWPKYIIEKRLFPIECETNTFSTVEKEKRHRVNLPDAKSHCKWFWANKQIVSVINFHYVYIKMYTAEPSSSELKSYAHCTMHGVYGTFNQSEEEVKRPNINVRIDARVLKTDLFYCQFSHIFCTMMHSLSLEKWLVNIHLFDVCLIVIMRHLCVNRLAHSEMNVQTNGLCDEFIAHKIYYFSWICVSLSMSSI